MVATSVRPSACAMWCARGCSRFPESLISRWRRYRGEAVARLSGSCTRMKSPRLGNTPWYEHARREKRCRLEEDDVFAGVQHHGAMGVRKSRAREPRPALHTESNWSIVK